MSSQAQVQVPDRVLDLFAVPGAVRPLTQDAGSTAVVAGDLVLAPGRDAATCAWLSPLLARLAVSLDERPVRARRDLRVALPVPARDGSWVVDGWAAARHEPGCHTCTDPDVVLAAGRLLHAELAVVQPTRPDALDDREDRWSRAERLAFGPADDVRRAAAERGPGTAEVVDRLLSRIGALAAADLGPDQLVHGALAGNVLLDATGAVLVVDVAPSWRPVRWAEALAALDTVRTGADRVLLERWTTPVERLALARASLFRVLAEEHPDPEYWDQVLPGGGVPPG